MRETDVSILLTQFFLILIGLTILASCNNRSGLENENAPKVISTDPDAGEENVATGTVISAEFDEEMDPSTINNESFILQIGDDTVSGSISYSDNNAVFRPHDPLNHDQEYTVTITPGAENIEGSSLSEDFNWKFTTRSETDDQESRPQVLSTDPEDGDTDISENATIIANFEDPLGPETINSSSFTLQQNGSSVQGSVSYDDSRATFDPDNPLNYTTEYTAELSTDIEDTNGNAMEDGYSWSFTTREEPDEGESDNTPPEISSTNPGNNAQDVDISTSISAEFSERMNQSTINASSFTVEAGGTAISGSVSYAGERATFTPNDNLDYDQTYEATITSDATDEAGNSLEENYQWSFTTEEEPDQGNTDENPPEIEWVSPSNNEDDVNVNTNILAEFNEQMDPSTVNSSSFAVEQNGTSISGNVSYSGERATFNPDGDLAYDQTYNAVITTGVTDEAGNNMEEEYRWSFTTENEPDNDPPSITDFSPDNGAEEVSISTSVSVEFSEPIDESSINGDSFLLSEDGDEISGSVSYSNQTATFTPDEDLAHDQTYQAAVTTDVADEAGNNLEEEFQWNFTTEQEPVPPPQVVSTSPENNEDDIDLDTTILVTFSQSINPATVNEGTFTVEREGGGPPSERVVEGSYEVDEETVAFEPDEDLEEETFYIVTLSGEIENTEGVQLEEEYSWEFETDDD